jgi:hypothetical protein
MVARLVVMSVSLVLAGCGGGRGVVANSGCASGASWAGSTEGAAEMSPGLACLACHAQGEGPTFALAGTVYSLPHEADNCLGVATSVTVQITDANGVVTTLTPNSAGNFSLGGRGVSVALPYTAKLLGPKGEKPMATPQSVGDCNVCHTAQGASGAPGRIFY